MPGQGRLPTWDVCLTHYLWTDLSERLRQFLGDITLADLVSREDIQRVRTRQDKGACANQDTINLERII